MKNIEQKLARGDYSGETHVKWDKPTVVKVRRFVLPEPVPVTRFETVTELKGYVNGGWQDSFLLKQRGEGWEDCWTVTLESKPCVTYFQCECGAKSHSHGKAN